MEEVSVNNSQEVNFCPLDRNPILKADVFTDTACKREIFNLQIYCTNKNRGCPWSDSLQYHQNHIETCQFEIAQCPLTGCSQEMERRHQKEHMDYQCPQRIVHCEYCRSEIVFSTLEQHKEKCEDFPLKCWHGCEAVLVRKRMPHHILEDCPRTVTGCPYSEFGCQFQAERQYLVHHQEDSVNDHLLLTYDTVSNLQRRVEYLEKRLKRVNTNWNYHFTFTWKITDVFVNMPTQSEPYTHYRSDPFVIPGPSGFKLCGVCTLFFGLQHLSEIISKSSPPVYVATWIEILENMKFPDAEWPAEKFCKIIVYDKEPLHYITGHVIPKTAFDLGNSVLPGRNITGQKLGKCTGSREFFVQIEVPLNENWE